MSEDDDWFEDALDDEDADADADDWDEVFGEADADGRSTEPTDESGDAADQRDSDAADDTASTGPFDGGDIDGDDSESRFGSESGGESPFEGGSPGESESPFGEETGGGSPFEDSGDDSLFDEDFGSAFESGGDDEFDEEDFDSDIPRIDLGIEGLDDMIQGGVPERHLMVTIGSAGTGKTTFGLQFLYHGLQQGDNAVFITLEQSHESIIDTANEWGWDFDEYEAEDQLAVVDLDPVEMANSLDNIRGELPELIKDFDADRLVLDSVSLLEMMYDQPAKRRTEVFDFTRSLKEAGVTTFLTSEASESNPYASRHGIIEYLTDAVFILQYIRGESRETRLAVEIQKIRNANHSREMKPYEITDEGLSVYQQANIF